MQDPETDGPEHQAEAGIHGTDKTQDDLGEAEHDHRSARRGAIHRYLPTLV